MKTPDRLSAASVATVSAAPARKLSPDPLLALYQSSIGKKIIVAVTGWSWLSTIAPNRS